MNLKPYSLRTPPELSSFLPKAAKLATLNKIILPTMFFSADGRMLLVGRDSDGVYKLPSREVFTSNIGQNSTEFNLPTEIKKLTDFLFYGEINPSSVALSGLVRHKTDNRVLICPVVASLESVHDRTELIQNPKWITNSKNPDFWWLSEQETTNIVQEAGNTSVTHNTRTIIEHSLSTVVGS